MKSKAEKIKSFDLITCLEVLEHVKKPKKALGEMRRCLKDGGWLIVLVPTESLLFRLIWFFWTRGKGRVWKEAHLQKFNGRRLEELLRQNGLKVDKRTLSHLAMLRAIRAKKKGGD